MRDPTSEEKTCVDLAVLALLIGIATEQATGAVLSISLPGKTRDRTRVIMLCSCRTSLSLWLFFRHRPPLQQPGPLCIIDAGVVIFACPFSLYSHPIGSTAQNATPRGGACPIQCFEVSIYRVVIKLLLVAHETRRDQKGSVSS